MNENVNYYVEKTGASEVPIVLYRENDEYGSWLYLKRQPIIDPHKLFLLGLITKENKRGFTVTCSGMCKKTIDLFYSHTDYLKCNPDQYKIVINRKKKLIKD